MYFRLLFVTLKNEAEPIQEVVHDGTPDSALAQLHSLMREHDGVFGQMLAEDGWVLANIGRRS